MAGQDDAARIHAIMLQEAQEEIGKLRAELYGARRAAEDRRRVLLLERLPGQWALTPDTCCGLQTSHGGRRSRS